MPLQYPRKSVRWAIGTPPLTAEELEIWNSNAAALSMELIGNSNTAALSTESIVNSNAAAVSSEEFEIGNSIAAAVSPALISVPLDISAISDTQASAAARRCRRVIECDPHQPDLFRGIDIAAIGEIEMASLRDLLCGVLSVRDRRP